jgi:hypothetical protein
VRNRIPESLESSLSEAEMGARISWRPLGAEGSVIVVGILLALAVQAWWEGRQEQRQEIEYLTALRGELAEGLIRLQRAEAAVADVQHAHEALIGQFYAAALAPPDSLIYWLSALSWPPAFGAPTAVIDDLVSSGGIQLIAADRLRLAVAEYAGSRARFEKTSDQAWATWTERIQPYLEARVSRVDRLRQGRYPRPVPFAPSPFAPSYEAMFGDPAFESMIAERWTRLDAARSTLDEVRSLTIELLALIGVELGTAGA